VSVHFFVELEPVTLAEKLARPDVEMASGIPPEKPPGARSSGPAYTHLPPCIPVSACTGFPLDP
jgi:hypothetical protein